VPYKVGDKWRGVVQVDGRKTTKRCDTLKEAQAWEVAERKRRKSERTLPTSLDLGLFSLRYLKYAKRFAPKVFDEKRAVVKRILTTWPADTPIETITKAMCQAYLDEQAEARSANASNKDRKNLHAQWSWGIRFDLIKTNPWAATMARPHDRAPQYTPPAEDVLRVLAAAGRADRTFLVCYLQTGARRSELFRWQWNGDINFGDRRVRLGTRKTKDGSMRYRWMPMSGDLYDALKWQWENRQFKDSPFVFVDVQPGPHQGKPYSERRRFMRGLCRRAGVPHFGFHALRRFVASVLADREKVSIKKIQIILGHSNMATTERYIQHISNDMAETVELLSIGGLKSDSGKDDKSGSREGVQGAD
jgi:integrase